MEEAPNTDPKDELLELGFEGEGLDNNYEKESETTQKLQLHSHFGVRGSPNRLTELSSQNVIKPKQKPRIKLQDSRYGEWKKAMNDRHSLPFIVRPPTKSEPELLESSMKSVVSQAPAATPTLGPPPPPVSAEKATQSTILPKPRHMSPLVRTKLHIKAVPPVLPNQLPAWPKEPSPVKASTKMFRYIKLSSSQESNSAGICSNPGRILYAADIGEKKPIMTASYQAGAPDQILVTDEQEFDDFFPSPSQFDIPIGLRHPPLKILHKIKKSRLVQKRLINRGRLLTSLTTAGAPLVQTGVSSFLSSSANILSTEPNLSLHVEKLLQSGNPVPLHRKKEQMPNVGESADQQNFKSSVLHLQKRLQQFQLLPPLGRSHELKRSLEDIRTAPKHSVELRGHESSQFSKVKQIRPEPSRAAAVPAITGVGFRLDRKLARPELQTSVASTDTQVHTVVTTHPIVSDGKPVESTAKNQHRINSDDIKSLEQQILRDFRKYYASKSGTGGELGYPGGGE
jgi:hypothetical protein